MTLTRVTGKVFAENAQAEVGGIGQFGSAKTGTPNPTTDVATIQGLAAYGNGWGSAIITDKNFPPMEEVNGVLKTISYQSCYLLQEGIPSYDAGTTYSDTSIVKSFSGDNEVLFYRSIVDNNTGNSLSNTDYWQKVNFEYDPYSIDGQWVNSPKTLSTATSVGSYTIDLSTYLPNDNYTYELDIYAHMVCTTYQQTELSFGDNRYSPDSPYYNDYYYRPIMIADAYYTNYDQPNTTNLLYVTKNRILRFSIGNHSCSSLELKVYRYRRLGTNS